MAISATTSPSRNRPPTFVSLLALMGLLAGLCSLFALLVTAADLWREHVQDSWPQVTATIEACSVDPHVSLRSHTPTWNIRCRIAYRSYGGQVEATIRSRSTTSGWGGDIEQMRQWVARHPLGGSISVHYDPADPKAAVLTTTDMPDAGPRTPNNLKLLLISAVAFAVLLTVTKHLRSGPRS